MVFSGIGCVPEVVHVRAVCLEPIRVSVAQFALPKWPALTISVSGEHGCAGSATADGALYRISAGEWLDLGGHSLNPSAV